MIDPGALTDLCEYFDPLTDQQKDRARRTVCACATDAADAAELLRALGLYPGQETDDYSTGYGQLPSSANLAMPRT